MERDIFLQREGAICLKDCECIGIKVSSKVTGESVAKDLEDFFEKAEEPIAIIKDAGRVLNNGVEIYKKRHNSDMKSIDDITHVIANGLKKQFEKTKIYQRYMKMLREGATKLKNKGRFQAISRLNNWAKKLIDKFISTTNK